ncbi:hypothetical protein [Melghirimyces profundicolus]|uniref:hypothetical protein n=1 Tax=Melghirimyces profundicolus TaxID=1242148 RepID=UPI0011B25832|nr:hypothetical protein [Melghirimyces profundicolus]
MKKRIRLLKLELNVAINRYYFSDHVTKVGQQYISEWQTDEINECSLGFFLPKILRCVKRFWRKKV